MKLWQKGSKCAVVYNLGVELESTSPNAEHIILCCGPEDFLCIDVCVATLRVTGNQNSMLAWQTSSPASKLPSKDFPTLISWIWGLVAAASLHILIFKNHQLHHTANQFRKCSTGGCTFTSQHPHTSQMALTQNQWGIGNRRTSLYWNSLLKKYLFVFSSLNTWCIIHMKIQNTQKWKNGFDHTKVLLKLKKTEHLSWMIKLKAP